MKKRTVRYIGNLVIVIAFIYIIKKLYQYRGQLIAALNVKSMIIAAMGITVYTILPIFNALFYKKIVSRITYKKLSNTLVVQLYTKSNLYKYLPGNVMHYIGRNQIAVFSDTSHSQIAICTVLEVMVQAGSAFIVAAILSFAFVVQWIRDNSIWLYAIAALLLLVAICVYFFLGSSIGTTLRKKVDIKITAELVKCLLQVGIYYIFYQIISGILFLFLINFMEIKISAAYFAAVIGVYCFAWLVGLITPGAPGGLGVREAMLTLLLSEMVGSEPIIAAVVLNRIITIVGDLLAYPLSLLTFREQLRDQSQ